MARPDGRLLIIALLLSLLKLPAELVVNLGKGIRQVNNWYKHTRLKKLPVSLELGSKTLPIARNLTRAHFQKIDWNIFCK